MSKPIGYRIQEGIPCCANCLFGGFIGDVDDDSIRLCICEIMGECTDSQYQEIAVEPLAICDAWKPQAKEREG